MKTINVITYRDLKADGYDNIYEIEKRKLSSDTLIIKDNVIPGMYGYPDMYIRKMKVKIGANLGEYLIVSYTDYELTEAKRLEIIQEANKLINN